ncbi:MAG: ribbon-helix-helix protein, CopG family [Candidatus Limnocylindria bacterium]
MSTPKGAALSVRLPTELVQRLERAARRKGLPKSSLVERYLEEGLRIEAHPGITFRDGPAGRRPGLVRGPDVWEVVSTLRVNDGSISATAEVLSLTERDVRTALGYFGDHPDEIEHWIRANEEEAARAEAAWRRLRSTEPAPPARVSPP